MAAGHRRWRVIAQQVRAERRPCHLCGEAIDYSLQWPHHYSFSADHLIPTSKGGQDTYANCGATHLTHNAARHDDPLTQRTQRTDNW